MERLLRCPDRIVEGGIQGARASEGAGATEDARDYKGRRPLGARENRA